MSQFCPDPRPHPPSVKFHTFFFSSENFPNRETLVMKIKKKVFDSLTRVVMRTPQDAVKTSHVDVTYLEQTAGWKMKNKRNNSFKVLGNFCHFICSLCFTLK